MEAEKVENQSDTGRLWTSTAESSRRYVCRQKNPKKGLVVGRFEYGGSFEYGIDMEESTDSGGPDTATTSEISYAVDQASSTARNKRTAPPLQPILSETHESVVWTGNARYGQPANGAGILSLPSNSKQDADTAGDPDKATQRDIFTGVLRGGQLTGVGKLAISGVGNYVGQIHKGFPHGIGRMEFDTGGTVSGTYDMGTLHGSGHAIDWGGVGTGRYSGALHDGKPHGKGELVFSDGCSYSGEFMQGQQTGYGIRMFSDGVKYHGGFYKGVPSTDGMTGLQSFGSWELPNAESIVIAPAENGQPHGTGWLLVPDNQCEGNGGKVELPSSVSNALAENGIDTQRFNSVKVEWEMGWCRISHVSFEDGQYTGDIFFGRRHGSGRLSLASGAGTFDGEWDDGKISGLGMFRWDNGDSLSGAWVEGMVPVCDGKDLEFKFADPPDIPSSSSSEADPDSGGLSWDDVFGTSVSSNESKNVDHTDNVEPTDAADTNTGGSEENASILPQAGQVYVAYVTKEGHVMLQGRIRFAYPQGCAKGMCGEGGCEYFGRLKVCTGPELSGSNDLSVPDTVCVRDYSVVPHGEGEHVHLSSGDKYIGQFCNGVPHGRGEWVWGTEWGGGSSARAVICSGATETNSHHGGAVVDSVFGLWSGVRRYVGFNYDGQFVMKLTWPRSRPHGNGKQIFLDGSVFEGHFEHGRRMGAGTYKSAGRGKPVFEGTYVNGFPEGEGAVTWLNGDEMNGNFKKGKACGWIRFSFSGGAIRSYEGFYENGVAKGDGIMKLRKGSVYSGGFDAGLPHGQGSLVREDGSVVEGEFVHGKFRGVAFVEIMEVPDVERNRLQSSRSGSITTGDSKSEETSSVTSLVQPASHLDTPC